LFDYSLRAWVFLLCWVPFATTFPGCLSVARVRWRLIPIDPKPPLKAPFPFSFFEEEKTDPSRRLCPFPGQSLVRFLVQSLHEDGSTALTPLAERTIFQVFGWPPRGFLPFVLWSFNFRVSFFPIYPSFSFAPLLHEMVRFPLWSLTPKFFFRLQPGFPFLCAERACSNFPSCTPVKAPHLQCLTSILPDVESTSTWERLGPSSCFPFSFPS